MAETTRILYVDEDKNAREAFCRLFCAEDGYDVRVAESATEGLSILSGGHLCGLIVADFRLPETNGVDFLCQVCEQWPDTIRIVLAGYADTGSVVEAINRGQIYKFIPKPWNDEELKATISSVLQHRDLERQNALLTEELQTKNAQLEAINENLEQMVKQRTEALEIRNRVLQIAQGVLDVLPVAVFGIDAEQMIVQCNDVARDLFPAGFMGPLGSNRRELFPADLNRLLDLVATEKAPSAALVIKGRNFRGEVRRLDETLTQGVVLALIPG